MYRGKSQGRGRRGRGGGGSDSSGRIRGLFEKGVWKCDCNPCMPAEHFQVKKESPNKGRWFYTCQKKDSGCGFFLWDEDAAPRMESAVLNNSTSEPVPPPPQQPQQPQQSIANTNTPARSGNFEQRNAGSSGPRATTISPPPPYTPTKQPQRIPAKRKLPWQNEHDEQYEEAETQDTATTGGYGHNNGYDQHPDDADVFPWQLTGEEELSLSQAADDAELAVQRQRQAYAGYAGDVVQTPRKALKFDERATPHSNGLLTPDTTPYKPSPDSYPRLPEPQTPTPSRYTNTINTPLSASTSDHQQQQENLERSIRILLTTHNNPLSSAASTDLHILMERHAMKDQGVVRGRDVARQTIQKRDHTIVHQAQRIAELETELEGLRARGRR